MFTGLERESSDNEDVSTTTTTTRSYSFVIVKNYVFTPSTGILEGFFAENSPKFFQMPPLDLTHDVINILDMISKRQPISIIYDNDGRIHKINDKQIQWGIEKKQNDNHSHLIKDLLPITSPSLPEKTQNKRVRLCVISLKGGVLFKDYIEMTNFVNIYEFFRARLGEGVRIAREIDHNNKEEDIYIITSDYMNFVIPNRI